MKKSYFRLDADPPSPPPPPHYYYRHSHVLTSCLVKPSVWMMKLYFRLDADLFFTIIIMMAMSAEVVQSSYLCEWRSYI